MVGAFVTFMLTTSKRHGKFEQALIDLKELVASIIMDNDKRDERINRIEKIAEKTANEHDMVARAGNILKVHGK